MYEVDLYKCLAVLKEGLAQEGREAIWDGPATPQNHRDTLSASAGEEGRGREETGWATTMATVSNKTVRMFGRFGLCI